MALIINWNETEENGMRVEQSDTNPIVETKSVLFESLSGEFESGQETFRKSGSIAMKDTLFSRGFARGRIRTLWRRNSISTDQSEGWGGIYIMSDIEGIGTRIAPMFDGYQISDKSGTLKVFKITLSIPTLLLDTGVSFPLDTIKSLEVIWNFQNDLDRTVITVNQGSALDFSDLTLIGTVNDVGDSSNTPVQFSTSEGLFAQTLSHDHVASYSFDSTSVFRLTTI